MTEDRTSLNEVGIVRIRRRSAETCEFESIMVPQQLGHFHQARKACLKQSFSSNRCSCLILEEPSNHLELLCILPANSDINFEKYS